MGLPQGPRRTDGPLRLHVAGRSVSMSAERPATFRGVGVVGGLYGLVGSPEPYFGSGQDGFVRVAVRRYTYRAGIPIPARQNLMREGLDVETIQLSTVE